MKPTRGGPCRVGARPRAAVWAARPWATLTVAVVAGGCAWDTPQTSLVPRSDFARAIHGVYGVIAWVALAVALIVLTLLGWVLVRYRRRPDAPLPPQMRGHAGLEIAWTVAPALVLLVIAVPTVRVIFATQGAAPRDALEITVRARQWWWDSAMPRSTS